MNTSELLGQRIKDIFVWTKIEVGGLDVGQVSLELTNRKIIRIPWDFHSENIETKPKKGSKSLIQKSSDKIKVTTTQFHFPNGKTFSDIRKEVETKQKSTFLGRIKSLLGIHNYTPKKYTTKTIEIVDNEIKNLENLKIIDFLMFEDDDSVGYLELENGYLITETLTAPHGTGMAGLNIIESLEDFESQCGTDYKRLSSNLNNL